MKALIFNSTVIQVEKEEFEVADPLFWVDCPDDCAPGWGYNGQVEMPVIIQPDLNELLTQFKSAIQEYVDSVAAQRQYASALYCASYTNSTNIQWKSEADTFIAWRDSVWNYCYEQLPLFESGQRPLIPVEQFLKELPAIVWP